METNKLKKQRLVITNAHCESCYKLIKMGLVEKDGVHVVEIDPQGSLVSVTYDPGVISPETITQVVANSGYEAISDNR